MAEKVYVDAVVVHYEQGRPHEVALQRMVAPGNFETIAYLPVTGVTQTLLHKGNGGNIVGFDMNMDRVAVSGKPNG